MGFARTLRQQSTWAARTLWQLLRNRQFASVKFRRQHPVGPYVLNFYCASAKLALELDDGVHGEPAQRQHDEEKDRYLRDQGIRVIRIWNIELKENRDGVLESIYTALTTNRQNAHPDPLPYTTRERGMEGVPSPPSFGGEGQDEGAGVKS